MIGEPTGLKPVHRHKGVLMEAIRLVGRAGHASNPALGRNAIDGMHKVLGALIDWRSQLEHRYHDAAFEVPGPTLNLGSIHGGDSPNRICAMCELQIDLRTLPEMSFEGLRTELKHVVGRALAGTPLELEVRSVIAGVPAFNSDRSGRLIGLLESLSGVPAGAVTFATEGPFFYEMGLETAVLGAGDIAQAHQPDEYVALDRFPRMATLLRGLIVGLCGPA
jgi:acetylornithine deacetylase